MKKSIELNKKQKIIVWVIRIAIICILVAAGIFLYTRMFGRITGELNVTTNTDNVKKVEIVECVANDYEVKKCRLNTKYQNNSVDFSNTARYGLYTYVANVYIGEEIVPIQFDYMKASNSGKSDFTVDIYIEESMGVYNAYITMKRKQHESQEQYFEFYDIISKPVKCGITEV